ncbi:pirin family protein [Luedemannella flava]|uniref:Pirin family protein n=1 Tax=Luedemannella flava TaxID=349316 RepID=A0ABN2LZD8_9ACTN
MSNTEREPAELACGTTTDVAHTPVTELLPGRDVPLGRHTVVRRLLPQRHRRMVGAWCFLDHYGPEDVSSRPGMQVPPHPHTGLQTVSWLLDGEILHRDSLGSVQSVRPGQLNLMTSGAGISHSEESPADHPPLLHGLQLWVALPAYARDGAAAFDHHADLPTLRDGPLAATVVVGEFGGLRSPARAYTPLVGVDLTLRAGGSATLTLDPSFEYAVVVMAGTVVVAGVPVTVGSLLYLGCGRSLLDVTAAADGRFFLFGGEPFAEPLVMWWNFVGRTHEEVVAAREAWGDGTASDRFGTVHGYDGAPLPAPPLPTTRLIARDREGRS